MAGRPTPRRARGPGRVGNRGYPQVWQGLIWRHSAPSRECTPYANTLGASHLLWSRPSPAVSGCAPPVHRRGRQCAGNLEAVRWCPAAARRRGCAYSSTTKNPTVRGIRSRADNLCGFRCTPPRLMERAPFAPTWMRLLQVRVVRCALVRCCPRCPFDNRGIGLCQQVQRVDAGRFSLSRRERAQE